MRGKRRTHTQHRKESSTATANAEVKDVNKTSEVLVNPTDGNANVTPKEKRRNEDINTGPSP